MSEPSKAAMDIGERLVPYPQKDDDEIHDDAYSFESVWVGRVHGDSDKVHTARDAEIIRIATMADIAMQPERDACEKMAEALKAMLEVQDESCRFDHHGLCQSHNLRRNDAGEPECQVELARQALAAYESARKKR